MLAGASTGAEPLTEPLDPRLGRVVELAPVGAEELDPVVAPGVVRGGDHDGQVEPEPADEHRGGGGRQHAGDQRVAALAGDAGGERGLEHRPRLAGVADDQDLRPLGGRLEGRGAARAPVPARRSAARPATPRTPSVPNSLRAKSELALGELRPLARLLQPRLAAFLLARVAGQQAAALELGAQLGVDLGQRPGDAVADGAGLAGDAAAVDADVDVDAATRSRR